MYRSAIITTLAVVVFGPATASADTPSAPTEQVHAEPSAPALTAQPHPVAPEPTPRERVAEQQLTQALQSVWAGQVLRRGITAVYVVDARTGRRLYAQHEHDQLNPASNVKLVASAAALDILGPDWRYAIRLVGARPDTNGVVAGDVYLKGVWDPTLTTNGIRVLASRLAEAGVKRIDGSILVGLDTTLRDADSGQGERDSIHDPRVTIRVTGASRPGQRPTFEIMDKNGVAGIELVDVRINATTVKRRSRRHRSALTLNSSIVDDAARGAVWRIDIDGRIPTNRRSRYRRIAPDGGVFTGRFLRAVLAEAGIEVAGVVRRAPYAQYMARFDDAPPIEIARDESAPLHRLAARINKRSVNYLADSVTMAMGAARFGGEPSMDKGVRAMYEWLQHRAGIDPSNVRLDTGSGLSYNTELTAAQLVRVLRVAGGYTRSNDAEHTDAGQASIDVEAAAVAGVYRQSLAVGGVDGTLKRRYRRSPARRQVLGKTGTLTRVIALSGIVRADEDNELVFAIVSNGHVHNKRRAIRQQHDLMVEAMYRFLVTRRSNAK